MSTERGVRLIPFIVRKARFTSWNLFEDLFCYNNLLNQIQCKNKNGYISLNMDFVLSLNLSTMLIQRENNIEHRESNDFQLSFLSGGFDHNTW